MNSIAKQIDGIATQISRLILSKLTGTAVIDPPTVPHRYDLGVDMIECAVRDRLRNYFGDDYWFDCVATLVDDDGRLFCTAKGSDGTLYRLDVVVSNNEARVSDPIPATMQFDFAPNDGVFPLEGALALIQSSTSVPSRDGRGTSAFTVRSFVEFEDKTGIRPQVDFNHTNIRIGQVVDSYQEGHVGFDVIQFDDTPLGRYFNEQIKKDPNQYEVSNQYWTYDTTRKKIDGEFYDVDTGHGVRTWVAILTPDVLASHVDTGVINIKEKQMAKTLDELMDSFNVQTDEERSKLKAQLQKHIDSSNMNPHRFNQQTTPAVPTKEDDVAEWMSSVNDRLTALEEVNVAMNDRLTALEEVNVAMAKRVSFQEKALDTTARDGVTEALNGILLQLEAMQEKQKATNEVLQQATPTITAMQNAIQRQNNGVGRAKPTLNSSNGETAKRVLVTPTAWG